MSSELDGADEHWARLGIGFIALAIGIVLLYIHEHWPVVVDVGILIARAILFVASIFIGTYILGTIIVVGLETFARRAEQWLFRGDQ